ncbi:MAG: LPS-assembly lipoprotein [Pseudohongiellaceae bacterium]|jgi:LPS-assembly lipoprotein
MTLFSHFFTRLTGYFSLFILCGLISGCGFQLRGTQALPDSLNSLNFQCANEKTWDLCRQLSREFQLHQIKLSDEAEMTLTISEVNKKQRSVSIDSNASTAEYDLIYSVRYKLVHAATQTLVSSQLVEASQSYRHKSSALIAKEREQDEIQTKLNQKIANIIFRQLSVFDAQRIQQAINLQ